MEIKRNGSQSSGKGSADYFTGTVRIDPLFQASEPARGTGASVTFRTGRPHRLAHPSARTDADRHCRGGTGAALGRSGRGNQAGPCGLVSARREALARRFTDDGNDAHRHPGTSGWQGGRLAGARDR